VYLVLPQWQEPLYGRRVGIEVGAWEVAILDVPLLSIVSSSSKICGMVNKNQISYRAYLRLRCKRGNWSFELISCYLP
jgi:hypothetical protein